MYAVVTDDKLLSCDVQPDTYVHTYVVVTANKVVVMADKLLVSVDKVVVMNDKVHTKLGLLTR